MEYRIKPNILEKWPVLVTVVPVPGGGFKSVSLSGKPVTFDKPASAKSPGERITIPAATQKEMELIHKSGHPHTEAVASEPDMKSAKVKE